MNKKLIALAIAGAFAPVLATADDSTVTIYGKLSVGIETAKAEGCVPVAPATTCLDIPQRARVTDAASYIGFRGSEPLGDGFVKSAFFQVESLVKADSGPGPLTGVAANSFASRNSGVGLRGAFGEILFGRWDVYYTNHIPAGDALFVKSGYNATILAVMGGGFAGIGGIAQVNINQGRGSTDMGGRRDNLVRYVTPNWGGFIGKLAYVAPEATTNVVANSATSNAGKASDKGVEVSLTYLNPNIGFANYSYYKRDDFGAVLGNDTTNQKIAIGTKLVGFTIGVIYERAKHENPDLIFTPAADSVDRQRDAYGVLLAYETGPWVFGTSYAQSRKVKDKVAGTDLADSGAKFYQVTVNYNFSKRTNLYLTAARITNESRANYDFFAQAGLGDSGPGFVAPGADPQSVIIGINHFF